MSVITRMRRAQRAWNDMALAELARSATSATRSTHEAQPRGKEAAPPRSPQGDEARQGKDALLTQQPARAGQDTGSCGHYLGLDRAQRDALIDDCACQIKDPMNADQLYERRLDERRQAERRSARSEQRDPWQPHAAGGSAPPVYARPAIEGPYTREPLWSLIGLDVIVAALLTLLAVHELHEHAPLAWPAVTVAGALVLVVRIVETALTFHHRRR